MSYTITELNQMNEEAFVEALGAVFEHTPSIAQQAWTLRLFTDVNTLHQKMVEVVQGMSQAEQLALIRAHPDLGSKAKMAEASVKEQTGIGLNQLTPEEYDRILLLNQAYKDKFGFPFIIAVKNHTKATLIEAFECRLKNPVDAEMELALSEIAQIAKFRLLELVA
ncbi:2-oxo-4-hydroxy-4-carboxy-5-ureidoimidazoline decarboxylase [Microcoleus sp. FACHB-SPT15]|uniref:2-oxo-4-hydroxy-4-carboxy-5-ureidoimidazoline decarboxylase n=1 Tax=Microcoleus sp. FACHB-SPT15 TaxID=2692830 RepID=UPI00177F4705|nr:2-oxo-4-hydroxy-4-carboxy-5-ureidoimidazoline decarboxylase [Microcoleus sp. FACHB-SPT15]MBD1804443.1 2-oxo-4-hydroxy-4-carboxy-5-ureidoimidazoline decarboxylase [Microcoleus sp. FACHB-SPT15]